MLVGVIVGAAASLGATAALGGFDSQPRVVERSVAVQPVSGTDDDGTVAAIVARTAPAVAAVRVERDGTASSASAIVLRSDGHLLTNAHVVDSADTVEVRLHGGTSAPASVVGTDPLTDLAVLHVDAERLEPAALGTVDAVAVGDRAVAVGMVRNSGWSTEVTTGLIRGLDRRLRAPDGTDLHGMMLFDAPLADGVDGGPLVDDSGAVVGITSEVPATTGSGVRTSSATGDALGVATPIDVARRISDEIIDHGRPRHVWLGVEGSDLDAAAAVELGIAGGASISRVVPDGPAERAGVLKGDVIVAVGEEPVGSMSDLIAALRLHEPGDEVTVSLRRGDDAVSARVALAERS